MSPAQRTTVAERLLERLRQAGIDVPAGARCVRNRVATWQREEGAWSWRVDGPDGIPADIGGWNTMTELVRVKAWDIDTNEFGETTVCPLVAPVARSQQWHGRRQHTFNHGD